MAATRSHARGASASRRGLPCIAPETEKRQRRRDLARRRLPLCDASLSRLFAGSRVPIAFCICAVSTVLLEGGRFAVAQLSYLADLGIDALARRFIDPGVAALDGDGRHHDVPGRACQSPPLRRRASIG